MAVSRRVSKLAVVRNRIRRQIRESFRLHRSRLPACDILVIARQAAAQQSNAQLRMELESLWSRLAAQAAAIER
jgi:ribonuclease P protein component